MWPVINSPTFSFTFVIQFDLNIFQKLINHSNYSHMLLPQLILCYCGCCEPQCVFNIYVCSVECIACEFIFLDLPCMVGAKVRYMVNS